MAAQRAPLPNGRWHFQHGPIDIVIGADGDAVALAAAHAAAWQRFETVLDELVHELRLLRAPVAGPCPLQGGVARRMWHACRAVRAGFITPMAAVAGSVADELIGCYWREGITRAWVNNGGDIALHLAAGQSWRVGLYADLARFDADSARDALGIGRDPRAGAGAGTGTGTGSGAATDIGRPPALAVDGAFTVAAALPVRGVATSGWRGRSFSLGIADSVTVLARTAAQADAAATVVANAVNIDDARIQRRPACELKDDCDLGAIPVTVEVPTLSPESVRRALAAGARSARELQMRGLVWSAVLVCQGQVLTVDRTVDNVAEAAEVTQTAAAQDITQSAFGALA